MKKSYTLLNKNYYLKIKIDQDKMQDKIFLNTNIYKQ